MFTFSIQKQLDSCVWKEYKSESGRPYFHNTETKESKWTIPDELQELKGLKLFNDQFASRQLFF